jgi:hypothetical protein
MMQFMSDAEMSTFCEHGVEPASHRMCVLCLRFITTYIVTHIQLGHSANGREYASIGPSVFVQPYAVTCGTVGTYGLQNCLHPRADGHNGLHGPFPKFIPRKLYWEYRHDTRCWVVNQQQMLFTASTGTMRVPRPPAVTNGQRKDIKRAPESFMPKDQHF